MGKLETILTTPTIDIQSIQKFYQNRQKHYYALPTQRNFVWEHKRQSRLIQSLVTNYEVGNLLVHDNNEQYEFMDGQQRANTIERYLSGKFKIHEKISNVDVVIDMGTLETKEFKIAGKYFNDLDEEVKTALLTQMIYVKVYKNLTDNQINNMIEVSNSGKALTTIQRTRMVGGYVQKFVSELALHDFFDRKINIQNASKMDFNHEAAIYVIMLFELNLTAEFSTNAHEKYAIFIKDNDLLTEKIQVTMLSVIDYMNKVFPTKHKILTQASTPSIYQVSKIAMEEKVDPRDLLKFMDNLYEKYQDTLINKTGFISATVIDEKTKFILEQYKQANITKPE